MNHVLLLAEGSPLNHVVDHQFITYGKGLFTTFTVLSNHLVLLIAAAVTALLFVPWACRYQVTGDPVKDYTPRRWRNFFEFICEYLRKEVAQPVLGEHTDRFIMFVWSTFFFVLFVNLWGLIPLEPLTRPLMRNLGFHHGIGGAATGNLWVTGTLAFVTFCMVVINGLRLGGMAYLAHFCPGPLWLAPLLVPVEIVGLIAKIFALAVRLFANMVAGHVLLAVLLSFIGLAAGTLGTGGGLAVAVLVVAASVAFNFLELFVACLQAFIFTFLTTLFIGMAVVVHHEEAHE
jgi:F-type H+-transporting ATPase subunit a